MVPTIGSGEASGRVGSGPFGLGWKGWGPGLPFVRTGRCGPIAFASPIPYLITFIH